MSTCYLCLISIRPSDAEPRGLYDVFDAEQQSEGYLGKKPKHTEYKKHGDKIPGRSQSLVEPSDKDYGKPHAQSEVDRYCSSPYVQRHDKPAGGEYRLMHVP